MASKNAIAVIVDGEDLPVDLNETNTAKRLLEALPLRGNGSRWGDEIYFNIGIELPAENPYEEVEVGDVAYWKPGRAVCLFYGPTPASTSEQPRAASPVTVIGKLRVSPEKLKLLRNLEGIEVKKRSSRSSHPELEERNRYFHPLRDT